jgi:hypothetical protein
MQHQKVFDQKFIEQLPSFDKFSNPSVVALCKRNEPSLDAFRSQIEKWFQNLPENQKNDIYNRLRSLDDSQHLSAFYELLFHQYFLEENWKIQKHPLINGQTIDFVIDVPAQNIGFFMEVATLMEEEKIRQNEERYNKLLRKINAIETELLVSVHLKEWLSEEVKYDTIVNDITKWLSGLEKTEKAHYKIEVNNSGFRGSIDASYYSDIRPKSGCVFAWSPPVGTGNPIIEQVKTVISSKVKKYKFTKTSGKPFVIAICSSGQFLFDDFAIDSALYGNTVISFNVNNPKSETKVHRDNSGMVTPNPGLLGQPRNTRVSAIIFCAKVWNKEKMLYNMRVFHNPWAITELPLKIFEKMPQLAEIDKNQPGFITLGWHNDNKQYIVFE